MQIREDDLTGEKIAALLQEHLDNMYEITPPGSVHALDLEALRSPEITFWTVWESDELLGCGALKELEGCSGEMKNGEIKSMRTAQGHRHKGVASKILEHILEVAKARGYYHLYLETGSFPAFAPARSLYIKYGFQYCEPFADYMDDPNSVFMTKILES
jgi:putative acetyltransferase